MTLLLSIKMVTASSISSTGEQVWKAVGLLSEVREVDSQGLAEAATLDLR